MAGWPGVIVCACVYVLSPNWVYFTCLGKTYALTSLFLLVAAIALYRKTNDLKKIGLFSIASALAIGSRLTVAPAVGVLWLLLILQARAGKERWLAIASPIAAMAYLTIPFFGNRSQVSCQFWSGTASASDNGGYVGT